MKILILTNNSECKLINKLKNNDINLVSSYDLKDISEEIDIVFSHNYDKVIPENYFNIPKIGIFIIHSSDLPKGRGWAPIYYAIERNEEFYTISLLKVSSKVDEGNIFIKLKIKKPKFISNNNLRDIDEDGSYLIINKFLDLCAKHKIKSNTIGFIQDHSQATYNCKRRQNDNLLNKDQSIKELIYKILASSNSDYSAFIEIEDEKIYLNAKTEHYYKLNELEYNLEILI